MKLVVVGQGYVGLPLAMRAVQVGYDVIGYDVSVSRVQQLRAADSFIGDVSDDELADALKSERYTATAEVDDCVGFDIAVITVPTPLHNGDPDLSYIELAAKDLARNLSGGSTVILESTTYPGTTEEFMIPLLEAGSGLRAGVDFHVGYSPERIDPGNQVWTFQTTPKVVSGIDEASLGVVNTFYSSLVDETVTVSSTRVAEMTKLLENTFRHVNIALVNELSLFASQLGVNVWEAIDAAASKPFGFMKFTPGPGVGGHCLPIDPSYLSWKVKQTLGESFRFVELANDINGHMPHHVVERAVELLDERAISIKGAKVTLLGLSYKKNTSDYRESPSITVCEVLTKLGADVRIVDDWVSNRSDLPWNLVSMSAAELERADLVLLITDHDNVDYEFVVEHAKLIFDTRRRIRSGVNVKVL